MKKYKLFTVLGAILAMGITACGGPSGSSESKEESAAPVSSEVSSEKESKSSSQKHTHSYVEDPTQRVEPTCDQDGKKVEKCECGETKNTPIKALGHEWGEPTHVEASEGAVAYDKYECMRNNKADKAVKFEVNIYELVNANKDAYSLTSSPEGYIKFSSSTSKNELTFSFNSELQGQGKLYLLGTMDHWSTESSPNNEKTLFSGKDGNSPTEKDKTNLEIKLNDTELISTNKAALNTLLPEIDATHPQTASEWSAAGYVEFAAITVNKGLNSVSYKRVDSYNMAVASLAFVFIPQ